MPRKETEETRGLSQRELILELRDDVKTIQNSGQQERARIDQALAQRPTRSEMLKAMGIGLSAAGLLAGTIITLIPH